MTLRIELPPELQERLEDRARRSGQTLPDYARTVLESSIAAPPSSTKLLPDGLPPRPVKELLALAEAQGIPPINDPAELLGDFWPEDESVDEFLEARRRWQQVLSVTP